LTTTGTRERIINYFTKQIMRKLNVKTNKESSDLIKVDSNQSPVAAHPHKNMEYNRTVSAKLANLISENGRLRWLFEFVRECSELDFLIGKNKSKEWISVYRGLSKILQIDDSEQISAHNKFKNLVPNLYKKSIEDNFKNELIELISKISGDGKLKKYYSKEGFHQNELSRKYGINGDADSDFVIIDKEVVPSYKNEAEQKKIESPIQEKYLNWKREIQAIKPYEQGNKSFGNELDFLALDKGGNVMLIEFKHGTNTAGIYWSSLQVGVYHDIFSRLDKKEFEQSIFQMLKQKQEIGLIHPNWIAPKGIKEIIPVVMISEFDENGEAKKRFDEVLQLSKQKFGSDFLKDIRLYKFNNSSLIQL